MPQIMVALDVDTFSKAFILVNTLHTFKPIFKVGLELIYSPNFNNLVEMIKNTFECKIFIDAKLSDIPTTVQKATKQIIKHHEPDFLTVRNHAGLARQIAFGTKTTIVEVPQLTSDPDYKYNDYPSYVNAPAVACRPVLAKAYRITQPYLTIICPGVRLPGENKNDHSGEAFIPKDADYIVVGRPITLSDDPVAAFKRYEDYCKSL